MNSQFIGITFIVLPFSPSCWNIRKKVSNHAWISIFVKWSVKLSDLPVFRRGNHRETIISKSIADSYPGSIHPWKDIDVQVHRKHSISGLDKDLDQWVFHPLLFNLMSILLPTQNTKLQKPRSISSVAKPCEKTHFICLKVDRINLLNTYYIFRKTSKIYIIGVYN